ncbi:MAG: hypothetical protein ACRD3C_22025 [Vicinamibacterales bacterium]
MLSTGIDRMVLPIEPEKRCTSLRCHGFSFARSPAGEPPTAITLSQDKIKSNQINPNHESTHVGLFGASTVELNVYSGKRFQETSRYVLRGAVFVVLATVIMGGVALSATNLFDRHYELSSGFPEAGRVGLVQLRYRY